MRRILFALVVSASLLAGCASAPPAREATYASLAATAFAKRPDAQEDDRLVAAGGVEGSTDLARGNGLAPSWTFIFESVSANRLGCVVLSASGATLERKAYPMPANMTRGVPLDDAIDSPAAVAVAKEDPTFGQAAVRASRFIATLTSDETSAYWVVAAESPAGNVTAVEIHARDGSFKAHAYAGSPTASAARCP